MKETDLFMPVKDLFESKGYIVNAEVLGCDMTCILSADDGEDLLTVVELKKQFSVELLAQANERQSRAPFVFMAVPKPKKFTSKGKWSSIFSLLRRLGLGLIFVDMEKNIADIVIEANDKNDKRRNNKKKAALIREASNRVSCLNVGGCSKVEIMTYYKEQCIYIACCLKKYGVLTTKELRVLGSDDKKTASICNKNYYKWFIKVERATYKLSDIGLSSLERYIKLTENFDDKIESIVNSLDYELNYNIEGQKKISDKILRENNLKG